MKAFAAFLTFVLVLPTMAATRTWLGAAGNNLWSNPNNWSPVGTPQPGEELEFKGGICPGQFCFRSMQNDLPALRLSQLFFESVDYTLSGNPLVISNRITVGLTGASATKLSVSINCPITLGGDVTFVANYGTGGLFDTDNLNHLHINGPVNLNGFDLQLQTGFASGNGELLGDHASRIYLDGPVSGSGNLNIIASKSCRVEIGGSIGNTFNGKVANWGSLDWNGPLVLKKQSGLAIPSRFEISGKVELDRPNQIADSATVAITNGQLKFQGHDETFQTLEITGDDGETESTLLDTADGTLTLLGLLTARSTTKGVPVIRGNLALTGSHTFDVGGTEFYGLELQATISGPTDITKIGTASLILGGNSSFTGWLFVDGGSVEPRHPNALGAVNRGVSLRGGTLRLINVAVSGESLYAQGDDIALFSQGAATWAGEIRLERSLQIYGENLNIAHVITGPGGLHLFGGNITFSAVGQNTFTGPLEVNCEALVLNKPSNNRAFSGPLTVGGGFAPLHEVRWMNNFQLPAAAQITLHDNGRLGLNNFTDIASNLTFNGGQINLAQDSAFTITGNIKANPSSETALIDGATGLGALFLSGTRTFDIGDGSVVGPDLRIDARIATGGLIKMGEGTLALRGNNSFSGSILVNNGIVRADHDNALGSPNGPTIVNPGSTLFIGNTPDLIREPVTLNGTGFGGTNGALLASGAVVLSNTVTLASPSTIRVDASWQFTLHGVISGTGPLTKTGAGTLTLAGPGNNTYSGDTLVNAGTLQLDKPDFTQAVPGNLIVGSGGFFPTSATVRHFSEDQIWAHVTVNSGSLLDLNGHQEYILTLTLNGGGDVQTGSGLLTVDAGNSITVNPGIGAATSTISGALGLRLGNHKIDVGSFIFPIGPTGPELDIPAEIRYFNGIANIHKQGPGRARFGGANSFTGVVYVDAGQVIAASDTALGTTQGSTVVQTNGALVLSGGITTSEFLILDSDAFPALLSMNGSNVVAGGINLIRPENGVDVQPATGFLQILGRVGSVGGLTKTGPGTLQFWGAVGNDYAGHTVISNGVIEANRTDPVLRINRVAIPGDTTIGDDASPITSAALRTLRAGQVRPLADVVIHRSGFLEMSAGAAATLRTVTGLGRINLGGSTTSLTISNDVSFDFEGSISGPGALHKNGLGATMHFTGNHTFTGPTTIWEGAYRIDGRSPNSDVTVKANGSVRGDGQVGSLLVESDGVARPDSSVPGHHGGDLQAASANFLPGGILSLALCGPHPTGGNDSLLVSGPVTLGGTRLSSGFQHAPREGDVITLIRKSVPGAITGTFNGYPEGVMRTLGDIPVVMSYIGGDGNDVTLTVTNVALGFAGWRLESGNGNGLVEPDECNLVFVSIQNRRAGSLLVTNAVLRSATPGAVVTMAEASYPPFAAGSIHANTTPFQLRTAPGLACGTPVALELEVSVPGEGTFAIPFTVTAGPVCPAGSGGCESCTLVAGRFTTNSLRTIRIPNPFGAPSECRPNKPCPDTLLLDDPVRYNAHTFTNTTGADACITVQLHYDCTTAPVGALHVAAYLDEFNQHAACANFLGDQGAALPDDPPPFSFSVPAGARFEVVVMQRSDVPACPGYTLEIFGLPCPPPSLQVTRSSAPGQVLLQWNTAYPTWRLQSATSLNGPLPIPFQDVPGSATIIDGRYTMTNTASGLQKVYRLAQ
jgi:autotransporter-associated beta strand protein